MTDSLCLQKHSRVWSDSLTHVVSETRAMGLEGKAQTSAARQITFFSCELKGDSGVCALFLSRVPRRQCTVPGGGGLAFYCHNDGERGGFIGI